MLYDIVLDMHYIEHLLLFRKKALFYGTQKYCLYP